MGVCNGEITPHQWGVGLCSFLPGSLGKVYFNTHPDLAPRIKAPQPVKAWFGSKPLRKAESKTPEVVSNDGVWMDIPPNWTWNEFNDIMSPLPPLFQNECQPSKKTVHRSFFQAESVQRGSGTSPTDRLSRC